MKFRLLKIAAIVLSGACQAWGADAGSAPASPAEKPEGHWAVRIEVMMVAVPQDRCFKLLPRLRDPQQVDAAVKEIVTACEHREMRLTGHPLVKTFDGETGETASQSEQKIPSQYEPPQIPQVPSDPDHFKPLVPPRAFAYETRKVGPRIRVTPIVSESGSSILLSIEAERRELLETEYLKADYSSPSGPARIPMPQFVSYRDMVNTSVRNGEHVLLGVHPLVKPAGTIELFILQATARPLK